MSSDVGRRRTWTSERDDTTARTGQKRVERLPRPHIRPRSAAAAERHEAAVEECLADRGGRLEAAVARRLRGRHRRVAGVIEIVRRRTGYTGDGQTAQLLLNEFADQPMKKVLQLHLATPSPIVPQCRSWAARAFRRSGGRGSDRPARATRRAASARACSRDVQGRQMPNSLAV